MTTSTERVPRVRGERSGDASRSGVRICSLRSVLAVVVFLVALGGLAVGSDTRKADAAVGSASDATAEDGVGAGAAESSNKVYVGVYVNAIQQVDLEQHMYTVDFHMWFRWTNPEYRPADSIDFINDAEQWGTTIELATSEPLELDDGSLYQRAHLQSRFSTNMALESYPFDRQLLLIVVEDRNRSVRQMEFIPDDPGAISAPKLSVPGYKVAEPKLDVVDFEYPELGVTGQGPQVVSQIVVSIPMSRPWLPYALKIFVPFIVIVLCTALVFLIGPDHFDVRFGLGISALLTLVALKWTTDAQIPLVDFVGMVDWLYLAGFVFVGLSLIETTYTTWRYSRGAAITELERIDRRVLLISSVVFVAVCVTVIVGIGH